MKMYMPLCVRESGIVRWHLSEGAALKPGDRLATLELDDPSAVTMAEVRGGAVVSWSLVDWFVRRPLVYWSPVCFIVKSVLIRA